MSHYTSPAPFILSSFSEGIAFAIFWVFISQRNHFSICHSISSPFRSKGQFFFVFFFFFLFPFLFSNQTLINFAIPHIFWQPNSP
ncbi:hypothetical protein RJT34_18652 [Clitoria ternatea]|uniref:Uncharacterized protein n=1 Tax=Clitoria ternatea TaxID=43366 RepID=A0AAN9JB75_CLITE